MTARAPERVSSDRSTSSAGGKGSKRGAYVFGNLRRLERGRVAPIRHRQVAGRPHELRATHRDVPPAREWQYPKMDGRPSPPFPSSSPPPSSEVTPRDPPPHSTPPTPRATSDGPARRAASSHASETRRRGEARGPDEWSRVACRTRGRRLAEPRAVGALPGVTDYGDLRRRARGSRYPTSDCSQERLQITKMSTNQRAAQRKSSPPRTWTRACVSPKRAILGRPRRRGVSARTPARALRLARSAIDRGARASRISIAPPSPANPRSGTRVTPARR